MGGRGAVSTIGKAKFDEPLNIEKTSKIFKALPKTMQDNIKNNLQLSDDMKNDIANGRRYKIADEWTTGIAGSKTKMKVITDVNGKSLEYTVKIGKKIVIQTKSKVVVANTVAQFYTDEIKKR